MKYSAYCRNKKKSEAGFTLLEMILVITISSLLAAVFLQLICRLYQNNQFFNLQNAWQLDAYLAVDFMALQIKNAARIEVISQQELDIFSYYDQDYRWLKFNVYQSGGDNALGRKLGSKEITVKDFGKNMALLNEIEDLRFEIVEPGLLKLSLFLKEGREKLTVSRLIKIG
jgi:prepilin-type N-terminal cleavage/methylation domain-containing protein